MLGKDDDLTTSDEDDNVTEDGLDGNVGNQPKANVTKEDIELSKI
jgi:hypothetical protein